MKIGCLAELSFQLFSLQSRMYIPVYPLVKADRLMYFPHWSIVNRQCGTDDSFREHDLWLLKLNISLSLCKTTVNGDSGCLTMQKGQEKWRQTRGKDHVDVKHLLRFLLFYKNYTLNLFRKSSKVQNFC